MNRRALAAALLGLTLTGCATTAPHTPSAGPQTVPPTSPASVPPSVSVSPSPSVKAVVLGGSSLASFGVGAAEKDVQSALKTALGKADESDAGPQCSVETGSPYAETFLYGDGAMWVQYVAADTAKSSPRTLFNWGLILDKGAPKGVTVQDGVPLDLSWKKLMAKYPDAKKVDLGVEGTTGLRLSNKLLFTGDTVPIQLQGGKLSTCE